MARSGVIVDMHRFLVLAVLVSSAAFADPQSKIDSDWRKIAIGAGRALEAECPDFAPDEPTNLQCAFYYAALNYEVERKGGRFYFVLKIVAPNKETVTVSFGYDAGKPAGAIVSSTSQAFAVVARADGWLGVLMGGDEDGVRLFIDPNDPMATDTSPPKQPSSIARMAIQSSRPSRAKLTRLEE